MINTIDFTKLPNLLLIDEITHFSTAEIQLLNKISEASKNRDNSNFFKIVALGDQNQLGYTVKVHNNYYNYNIQGINSIYTPVLFTTVRSANDQKRTNNDILLNLSKTASQLTENISNATVINEIIRTKLKDINTETGLKYYLDKDNFKGDYIIKNYNQSEPFKVISNLYKNNPELKIGVLTEGQEINPNLINVLNSVGIKEDNLIIFTPETIQGSEVDYLIFGTADIFKYNRLKEQLKALYTFASRSTAGSIIIDLDDRIANDLMITNTDKSEYYREYDPLTKEVINSLKEEKINDINTLLGGNIKIDKDLFK
ncbi:MAG: hypothetical protein PHX40_01855 [Bacilli bacterium]|nr:hypothetical protein [Bacilli bacterium]